MIDVYMEKFEHPYLLALVPIACVLFTFAVIASVLGANTWAGFLALYTMAVLIICVIGHIAVYTIAYSTEVLRQWRIRRSKLE
ncbi:hypothetical protein [Halopiger aswanensis]|uniref:Uncharacterized protein n=1 Tax=Halopiger aswanensis TaxID=148449 RepID=A0A419WJA3_9EURY|nr:hypothetical protein [Halopiger aswanensis]RKD95554.1 hypothetical protein ATJ93_2412 [Halopiger aswanensis]